MSFDDPVFVEPLDPDGLFPPFLPLLRSSDVVPVVRLSNTIANSSSNGTASSSSSLGNRSPLELKELVVLLLSTVPLLLLVCPLASRSGPSSINGPAPMPLLPTLSCRFATLGLYRTPLPPIFHGNLSRNPNILLFGTILTSSSPSSPFLLPTPRLP